jgi:hypothetical protein
MSGRTGPSRRNLHIGLEKARGVRTEARATGARSSPQGSGSNRFRSCVAANAGRNIALRAAASLSMADAEDRGRHSGAVIGACAGTRSASRLVVTVSSNVTLARAQPSMSRRVALTAGNRCWEGVDCLETEGAISFMKPFHRCFARYGQQWVVPRGVLRPVRTHSAKSRLFLAKAHREPPPVAPTRSVFVDFLDSMLFNMTKYSGAW